MILLNSRNFLRQLMIPWSIMNSSGSYETSNMNINLALMDLLPDGFINKKRIIGEGFMANILRLNLKKTREL